MVSFHQPLSKDKFWTFHEHHFSDSLSRDITDAIQIIFRQPVDAIFCQGKNVLCYDNRILGFQLHATPSSWEESKVSWERNPGFNQRHSCDLNLHQSNASMIGFQFSWNRILWPAKRLVKHRKLLVINKIAPRHLRCSSEDSTLIWLHKICPSHWLYKILSIHILWFALLHSVRSQELSVPLTQWYNTILKLCDTTALSHADPIRAMLIFCSWGEIYFSPNEVYRGSFFLIHQ